MLHGVRVLLVLLSSFVLLQSPLHAAVVTTKSGMQFEGRVDKIGSLNENPFAAAARAGEVATKPIVIIDDELRRTFVSNIQVSSFGKSAASGRERIRIQQRVASAGRRIGSIGAILGITDFDEYGRRTFSMQGPKGRLDVIQGITEITPTYTKVEGLLVNKPIVWDMRIATSSIDRNTLSAILARQIDQEDPDQRLSVVRLYIQAERYKDAIVELERVIADFPKLTHLEEQAAALRQLLAQRLLREIEHRAEAGQHERVRALLNNFPSKGIAGETLLRVRDMLAEYDRQKEQYDHVLELLDSHLKELTDEATRASLSAVHTELKSELNIHTLNRMADYLRLADDKSLNADQKLALAVSGWLLGSGAGTENLALALSLVDVRNEVRNYLRADRKHERDVILERIKTLEGGSPRYVAALLANMKPPIETQVAPQGVPGLYELSVPGIEVQPQFTYHVQLPPEYDPHRRYPCIVTLNGGGTGPVQQIDWWAGTYAEAALMRTGQAARHGYVVIAPHWTQPHQTEYEFSAREHAAVLFSLRDAIRRVSIDTDRVFLSGHSMGGDAAWDIGISHPDLWAGVLPIVARADEYIKRYHENARGLPLYFVGGELDGGWLQENGSEFDRYLRRGNYDCTVVQFQGRGHEHFQDEVQRIFEWTELRAHRRNFFPREWEVGSMRPWDNFFWWLELEDFPPESMVFPAQWPPSRGTRPIKTEARVLENNRVHVRTGARGATVWLAPEMVSFDRRIDVTVNSRDIRDEVAPSLEVLLEDVRTRGDRQHPFWAKVQWGGR